MKKITTKELKKTIKLHRDWLNGDPNGVHADLSGVYLGKVNLKGATLARANLSHADLSFADLSYADLVYANLSFATLDHADLSHAALQGANLINCSLKQCNLTGSQLSQANLTGCDLSYSSWPLWCGSLRAGVDDAIVYQLAYHLISAGIHSPYVSDYTKNELKKISDLANRFHRAEACGKIEGVKEWQRPTPLGEQTQNIKERR